MNFLEKRKKPTKIPKGKQALPKEKKKKKKKTSDFCYRSYKTYFSIIIH